MQLKIITFYTAEDYKYLGKAVRIQSYVEFEVLITVVM
jgi:hypothetical protein